MRVRGIGGCGQSGGAAGRVAADASCPMPSGGGCWRSWRPPGRRTRNWLKTKHYQRETFLVGGFVPDRDQVRSLLVSLPDPARPRCSSARSWPSRSPSWAGSRGGCATLPGAAWASYC